MKIIKWLGIVLGLSIFAFALIFDESDYIYHYHQYKYGKYFEEPSKGAYLADSFFFLEKNLEEGRYIVSSTDSAFESLIVDTKKSFDFPALIDAKMVETIDQTPYCQTYRFMNEQGDFLVFIDKFNILVSVHLDEKNHDKLNKICSFVQD
jgi:hypothetical protein